jgi:hypothetical protein
MCGPGRGGEDGAGRAMARRRTVSSAVESARKLVHGLLGWCPVVLWRIGELARRAERSSSCSTCKALGDRRAGSPGLPERVPTWYATFSSAV